MVHVYKNPKYSHAISRNTNQLNGPGQKLKEKKALSCDYLALVTLRLYGLTAFRPENLFIVTAILSVPIYFSPTVLASFAV